MPSTSRVLITGVGVISPIGSGESFRASLRAGRSGTHRFRLYDPSPLPVRFGGEIEEFDARDYLEKKDRKSLKLMGRTIQLAVAAARLAAGDAGLAPGCAEPERFGVALGCGVIPDDLADLAPAGAACLSGDRIDLGRWGREGLARLPPTWMLNHVPNMAACHVAIQLDARGPNNTITQGAAASLLAIGEAWHAIRRDAADVMLAGGMGTLTSPIAVLRS